MFVRKVNQSGFTLIEIVFTLTLVVILAGLSLYSLRPANSKAPSRGLATALAEELSAARQLAISTGHPVALGIPTGGNPVASSIYRLEGWNLPTITWSKGFSGDYPSCGFAAARWAGGGSWSNGAAPSVVSKLGAFNLVGQWLPSSLANDYIYCFTPDGGLVTNALPALDGRYTLVVGQYLSVASGTLNAAKDPITLFISPYGGIETVTGTPGGNVPEGTVASATSAPRQRTSYAPGEVRLSNIRVTPRLDGSPENEGFCVPGQYVTLEVYAYDPEGRGLFAKWKQPAQRGIFTYPFGGAPSGAVLESEVDRMEFIDKPVDDPANPNDDITWTGTAPPPGGLFRARWGWTVPENSAPGTVYEIEVDVKDAKGECSIVNPPPKLKMMTAPKGRIIAERMVNGIWQLVQLNPDGSNPRVISPVGIQETMASIDRTSSKMALLQGPAGANYVKIRSLDGGGDKVIAGPGNFTSVALSPDGAWVGFHEQTSPTGGTLTVRQADGTDQFTINQTWTGSVPNPPRCRPGFSPNSEFLLYEADTRVRYRHLASGHDDVLIDGVGPNESLYAPSSYSLGSEARVMFSVGNVNPVNVSAPLNQTGNNLQKINHAALSAYSTSPGSTEDLAKPDIDGSGGGAGSGTDDDSFPNVAYDGSFMALNRSAIGAGLETNQQSLMLPRVGFNFVGPPVVIGNNTRRPIWVPTEP